MSEVFDEKEMAVYLAIEDAMENGVGVDPATLTQAISELIDSRIPAPPPAEEEK